MTDIDILHHLEQLFEPTVSPGQAFDHLFALRRERIPFSAVRRVAAECRPGRLDEADETLTPRPARPRPQPGAPALQEAHGCPECGCGVPRGAKSCPNPHCESYPPESLAAFKDPRFSWGKYKGKSLSEVVGVDLNAVQDVMTNFDNGFWKTQARLALLLHESRPPLG